MNLAAVMDLLNKWPAAELAPLRRALRQILEARRQADADAALLVAWNGFSSLELAGMIAMIDHRLVGAIEQGRWAL